MAGDARSRLVLLRVTRRIYCRPHKLVVGGCRVGVWWVGWQEKMVAIFPEADESLVSVSGVPDKEVPAGVRGSYG